MSKRMLHVVMNAAGAPHAGWIVPVEAAWATLQAAGFEQLIVSPAGGDVDAGDAIEDALLRALLLRTATPAQIDAGDFDAIVFADDDATAELAGSVGLQRIARSITDHGGVLATLGVDTEPLAALCDDHDRVLWGADVPAALAVRFGN